MRNVVPLGSVEITKSKSHPIIAQSIHPGPHTCAHLAGAGQAPTPNTTWVRIQVAVVATAPVSAKSHDLETISRESRLFVPDGAPGL